MKILLNKQSYIKRDEDYIVNFYKQHGKKTDQLDEILSKCKNRQQRVEIVVAMLNAEDNKCLAESSYGFSNYIEEANVW